MSMTRNRKRASNRSKGMKMGTDELGALIKAAVKEAMGESDEKEYDDTELGEEVIAAADIADIIAEAVEAATEKRKSRKEEGEELGEDPTEDILAEVALIMEELADESKASNGREEPRDDDDPDDDIKSDDEEDEMKGKRKSARTSETRQRKGRQKAAPAQRKYSEIYIPKSGGTAPQNQKKIPPEIQLARAVKCLDVFGRHDPERAAYYAKKNYSDDNMANEFKALSATSPQSGGYLIPEIYLDEIIEMLYSKTVIFKLGARKVPLTNGNLNIPKMTSGARATWGGEQRKIAKSQPAYGNVKLSAKRLEAIVPQTRELLMSTNYSADAIFASDLTRRMELGLDWGALFGKGGEFQPLGVKNTNGILTIDVSTLSNLELVDASGKITADFPVYVRSKVLAKNVDDLALGWAFNSMMEGYLMNLKTTTGAYIYRDEMNSGKLLGFPYEVSNQIETDSSNKTEFFFGNWADLLVGEQLGLETYTTLDGSWTDEDGVQHNAFEENLAATRALMYDDIAARHAESFAYIKNCLIA